LASNLRRQLPCNQREDSEAAGPRGKAVLLTAHAFAARQNGCRYFSKAEQFLSEDFYRRNLEMKHLKKDSFL
jgi:hypothetical protein